MLVPVLEVDGGHLEGQEQVRIGQGLDEILESGKSSGGQGRRHEAGPELENLTQK
jgi:hypothetical protein